jgi:hypothetical protein
MLFKGFSIFGGDDFKKIVMHVYPLGHVLQHEPIIYEGKSNVL